MGFGLTLAAVVANATAFQKGRHPAPLFSPSPTEASAEPPAVVARSKPLSAPPAQAERSVASPEAPRLGTDTAPTTAPARHDDAIGRLIKAGTRPQAPSAAAKASGSAVIEAQRALAKLGYEVKPDGAMSAATLRAIAAFSHAHKLPVGEGVSPALLRELAAASASHPG